MHWREVSKCDPIAKSLAERHYTFVPVKSRKMGREVGPPGQKIVLRIAEKGVWGSHRPAPWAGVKRLDGFNGPVCFIFRNEGTGIKSSSLIQEAVAYTISHWGLSEFMTYVGVEHIASSNPGYCFIKAGFIPLPGYTFSRKIGWLRKLIMPIETVVECFIQSGLPLLEDRNQPKTQKKIVGVAK